MAERLKAHLLRFSISATIKKYTNAMYINVDYADGHNVVTLSANEYVGNAVENTKGVRQEMLPMM